MPDGGGGNNVKPSVLEKSLKRKKLQLNVTQSITKLQLIFF